MDSEKQVLLLFQNKMIADKLLCEWFNKYQGLMIRYAIKITGSFHDAEDIVSDCWCSICQNEERLPQNEDPQVKAYLLRCVHNRSVDYLRKNRRHMEIQLSTCFAESGSLPEVRADDNTESTVIIHETLNYYISKLPPREAEALKLRISGCGFDEISHIMRLQQTTVRGYLFRSIRKIREMYQQSWE